MTPDNPTPDPLAIKRLQESLAGRYRIDHELGRGGMATVYLAYDLKHTRQVALKVLVPDLAAPVAPGRFQREIRLAARLHHPHILAVYESGAVGQILWFTMPYVDGETLRRRMTREGRLPVAEALRITREAARALDYSHRQGVVHRDIKPENILITREGDSLIADFGIGRALGGDTGGEGTDGTDDTITRAGVLIGTPRYMSLEQVEGAELDGRTDIYSLGVVLYEMLAGAPPFAGGTAYAVVAQQLAGPPPRLSAVREEVSPELERLVASMLAGAREQRLGTAGELLQALESLPGPGRSPLRRLRRSARRLAAGVLGAVVVAAVAVGGYYWRGATRPTLRPAVVAVAPFDVADPGLLLWREGLVDLLSRDLDGTGSLGTVPPTVVVRRWSGRADPPSAAQLGRRTGAGLVLYGALLGSGRDSARLRATLFDVAQERPLGEWEVADAIDRMDRLTDSLTILLLEELGRTRPIGAVRRTGLRRTSLPAFKAFLQGEQQFRRGQWDSALVWYQRAISADSGFAPALRRAGSSVGWMRGGFDSLSTAYGMRAAANNHGLPPRDSLLITADSLFSSLLEAGPLAVAADTGWTPRLRRLFVTLEYATARYPDDPEAWFLLGDVQAHVGAFAGRSDDQQLEAFDRAIALDSGFAPSYYHAITVAATRGAGAMQRYLGPYLALGSHDPTAEAARLVQRMLDSPGDSASLTSLYLGVPDEVLLNASEFVTRMPDSAESIVSVMRFISLRPRSAPLWDNPDFQAGQVGRTLMSRGHLREARQFMRGFPISLVFGEAMLLGAAPLERGLQEFRERLSGPATPRLVAAFPWWASHGDTATLRLAGARADSLARRDPDANARAMARYAAASAAAYGALARADTTVALERLLALPDGACPACYLDRVTLAQLLAERHRDREAWRILQGEHAFSTLDPTATEVLWALLRGRVGERLGERDRALRSYAWVAGMWQNADPELQPYVSEAREGVARLTGERQ